MLPGISLKRQTEHQQTTFPNIYFTECITPFINI